MNSATTIEALAPRRRFLPAWLDPSVPIRLTVGAFLAFLVLLPFGGLIFYAITDEQGEFSLTNFEELGDYSLFLGPFINTLFISLGVGSLACAVAMPLAWLVLRTDVPWRARCASW